MDDVIFTRDDIEKIWNSQGKCKELEDFGNFLAIKLTLSKKGIYVTYKVFILVLLEEIVM